MTLFVALGYKIYVILLWRAIVSKNKFHHTTYLTFRRYLYYRIRLILPAYYLGCVKNNTGARREQVEVECTLHAPGLWQGSGGRRGFQEGFSVIDPTNGSAKMTEIDAAP